MNILRITFIFMATIISLGCVWIGDIETSPKLWESKGQKVLIIRGAFEKPNVYIEDDNGTIVPQRLYFLRMLFDGGLGKKLENALRDMSADVWYQLMINHFRIYLEKYGMKVEILSEPITIHDKLRLSIDGKLLKSIVERIHPDKILIINIYDYGVIKPSYSRPNSGTWASVAGRLVDLKTNETLWQYHAKLDTVNPSDWSKNNYASLKERINSTLNFAGYEVIRHFSSGVKED